ncbi:MAG: hypothetical protein DBX58_04090 [Clostridiales bacterium]|nr:MAG: hypothetical protein DBX58_04090 [Clostridiales bacterium]
MEGHKKGKMGRKKKILLAVAGAILLAVIIFIIYKLVVKQQMDEETAPRESWTTETGELLETNQNQKIRIYQAPGESDLLIYQMQPQEVENDGFTYYNLKVQERLDSALGELKEQEAYTLEKPLAVWNPYGTGSNGLYLYFEAPGEGLTVHYRIHVEDGEIPDFEADANAGSGTEKEFLVIGLVPGMENELEITLNAEDGTAVQTASFRVEAPETASGYDVVLEETQGESSQELTDGLYYTLGIQGYYGHMFLFDNDGVLRYEMLLDGYKPDRVLFDGEDMVCCVSANQIGKISHPGKVTNLYTMNGYVMHHDFCYGEDGTLLVLATRKNARDSGVMDRVLEIDMETGTVTEIVDLRRILPDYYAETEKVTETDPFFWQAGTRDWIHVNTIDYMDDDSIVLSARETSTIVKIQDLHGEPTLCYLIGDAAYWEGTGYEEYSYEKVGDFADQYGQHTVTVVEEDGMEEGTYYLMMYDNNYYANSTRTDDYEPVLPDSVSTDLMGDEKPSHVYWYLVNENQGTYELVWSFDVPYSSIVSSVQIVGDNYVVNSGVSNVFGEYDSEGNLIRQFGYECTMQGYRVMKDTFEGYWFS